MYFQTTTKFASVCFSLTEEIKVLQGSYKQNLHQQSTCINLILLYMYYYSPENKSEVFVRCNTP